MKNDTLLVYDTHFLNHVPPRPHPENPERLLPLHEALVSDPVWSGVARLDPLSLASERELLSLHTEECVQAVLRQRGEKGWFDPDTYFGEKSVVTALAAVGATKELAKQVFQGEYRRGFAIVRPPGHHARAQTPMGFCLFNNVGVAAAILLQENPRARLAVVDFDLHHGNGTQESFYESERVLFLSSHRYHFYPGTGREEERGSGAGKGLTVNFPLAKAYGDDILSSIYGRCALPVLEAFQPDLILVSAGYDGHEKDPMGGLRLTTAFYALLTEALIGVAERCCEGKIVFCLEGGYSPEFLRDSVLASLGKLLHCPRTPFDAVMPVAESAVSDPFARELKAFFPEVD